MISPQMQQEIIDSDYGPDIAYYFSKNTDEATEIANLPPAAQIKRMALIENRLHNHFSKRKISKAPDPITPLKKQSSVAGKKNPEEMSFQEFKEWRKKQNS